MLRTTLSLVLLFGAAHAIAQPVRCATQPGACRLIDAQTPYADINDSRHDARHAGRRYALSDSLSHVNRTCMDAAAASLALAADEVGTYDISRADDGYTVELDTPDGAVTCSVDRLGHLRSVEKR